MGIQSHKSPPLLSDLISIVLNSNSMYSTFIIQNRTTQSQNE